MKEENDLSVYNNGVSFHSPAYALAERLKKEGYEVGGRSGVANPKQLDPNVVRIFKKREPIQRKLFGIIKYNQKLRAFDFGAVWVNDADRKAKEDETWVFEPKGEKERSKLASIIKEVASSYNPNINVDDVLYDTKPGREKYLYEFY